MPKTTGTFFERALRRCFPKAWRRSASHTSTLPSLVACAARPTTFRRRSIDRSFHDYADYALSAEFASGLNRLVSLGRRGRYAVMCSETLWWRCRRRIIVDYLISHGVFSSRLH